MIENIEERVEYLLGRINLVKEINSIIAKKENIYDSLPNNKVFKQFIEGLKPFVDALAPPLNNWEEDKQFLKLMEVVNQQIINQLTEGEQKMTGIEPAVATKVIATKTAIVMGLGVIGLIGIGLYAYRCQQNKGNKKDGFLDKEKSVFREIKAGFDSSTSERPAPSSQPEKKPTPTYKQVVLLLVTDAKQLDNNLKQDSRISKDAAEKMIANATFAYCFSEDDSDGQNVLNAVECSDEAINYESEERVFLQLSLSAKPEITDGKRDKLGIREAMQPNQSVEIKRLQKLQTMRSVKAFHSI
jgi:hypothetical protein